MILKKPCASIDAELRHWDVLLGFGRSLLADPARHAKPSGPSGPPGI
jgi:hypothetical protein